VSSEDVIQCADAAETVDVQHGAVSEMLAAQADCVRARQAVIMANTELRERDLIKLASISAALAGTLRRHGVTEPAASLAAEAGVAVFKIGFERWIVADEKRELSGLMRESLDELKAVTAARSRRGSRS
jgi:hypothetical protein